MTSSTEALFYKYRSVADFAFYIVWIILCFSFAPVSVLLYNDVTIPSYIVLWVVQVNLSLILLYLSLRYTELILAKLSDEPKSRIVDFGSGTATKMTLLILFVTGNLFFAYYAIFQESVGNEIVAVAIFGTTIYVLAIVCWLKMICLYFRVTEYKKFLETL